MCLGTAGKKLAGKTMFTCIIYGI